MKPFRERYDWIYVLHHLEKNYKEELWINKDLDVAHIKPKSLNIDDRYDVENVILIGRFFHRRLTDMKHPVYDKTISQNEIEEILNNAKIKGKTNDKTNDTKTGI